MIPCPYYELKAEIEAVWPAEMPAFPPSWAIPAADESYTVYFAFGGKRWQDVPEHQIPRGVHSLTWLVTSKEFELAAYYLPVFMLTSLQVGSYWQEHCCFEVDAYMRCVLHYPEVNLYNQAQFEVIINYYRGRDMTEYPYRFMDESAKLVEGYARSHGIS